MHAGSVLEPWEAGLPRLKGWVEAEIVKIQPPFCQGRVRHARGVVFLRLVLCCLNGTPSLAAEVQPGVEHRLGLEDARRLAVEQNLDLVAAKADIQLAEAQRIIAREIQNPTLSLSTTKMSVDAGHPAGTVMGNRFWDRSYDSTVAVSQLLELGGKRPARQRSALAGMEVAEARFQDARRLLELGVTKAYIAALLAETNATILGESAASLRREAGIALQRERAGDLSPSERQQIELAAGRLELEAATARATAVGARISLEVMLGRPHPRGTWAPGDALDTLTAGVPADGVSTPGVPRPDVAAAEAVVRKSQADLRLARAQRVPDPTVSVQYEHEPPDQPDTVGIGISIPLPLWNRNRGAIRAAEAAVAQAEASLARARQVEAAEREAAVHALEEASARWTEHREHLLPLSSGVLKAVSFAYERGGATLLDLLNAQRNENDLRLAAAQAAADRVVAQAVLRSTQSRVRTDARQSPSSKT